MAGTTEKINPLDKNSSNDEFLAFMQEQASKQFDVDDYSYDDNEQHVEDNPSEDNEIVAEKEEEPIDDTKKENDDDINNKDTSTNIKDSDVNIETIVNNEPNTETDDSNQDNVDNDKTNEFEEYKKMLASPIEIDGLEVDGITDPETLRQIQVGYVEQKKLAKKYDEARPVIEALKKDGFLDDKDRLALAMKAGNGDTEAIKELIRLNNIDPVLLDMENIKVDTAGVFESDIGLKLNDMFDSAKRYGIQDKLVENVMEKWSPEAVETLLSNASAKNTLLNHMKTGAFDSVLAEITNLDMTDFSGEFAQKSDYDKYAIASKSLEDKIRKQSELEVVHTEPKVDATRITDNVVMETDDGKDITVSNNKEQPVDNSEENNSEEINQQRLEKAKQASEASSNVNVGAGSNNKNDALNSNSNEEFMKHMYSMMGEY